MSDMYYSVTFGFGEYGNLMGILFEEVEVDVENEIELSRKTVKEIKRERQDVNHVNIIEDKKIILKLYHHDNIIKKIEGNETHIMSANKFQSARYSKSGKVITAQSNGLETTIDIEKGFINEIKKIGKKNRSKRFCVNNSAFFGNNNKFKTNPIVLKLMGDISCMNEIYFESNNSEICRSIVSKTFSKETFKQERDTILKYAEEFLIFLNFGKQEV